MSLWEAVYLGLVQGLTEFLPISSSAHLRILPALLGNRDPGTALSAVFHLGSLLAVFFYFRREIGSLLKTAVHWIQRKESSAPDRLLFAAVVIGSIPVGIVGVLFRHWFETGARSLWVVAYSLIGFAILLAISEKVAKRNRPESSLRIRDGLVVGIAQVFSLIPGASRAGTCMTAGLFLGLERPVAARFAFLLGAPAMLGAGILEWWELRSAIGRDLTAVIAVGTAASFISGYFAIAGLIRFLQTRTTLLFVAYRILLGSMLIALIALGYLNPSR